MNRTAVDLFLLMTVLSQLKERRRIIDLFVESLEKIFPASGFRWLEEDIDDKEKRIEVCTRKEMQGIIAFQSRESLDATAFALIQNAGQMLGVLLEKIDQEQLLIDQNLYLEALVEDRTRHLQQKSDELDKYFMHTVELFCIADTDGYFRRLNRQWEVTFGYSMDEMVDHKYIEFIHPDDMAVSAEAAALLSSQKEVVDFVNRYRCKDGTYRWIEWRAFLYGKVIYAAARDITEKLKADESLQRAQKLESIGVLAGGIAHDFNNLLGGIFGFIEIAECCVEDGDLEEATACLRKACAVFDRAKGLTQQLLTFSKGGDPIRKAVDIRSVLQKNAQFVLSGSNISCHFDLPSDLRYCNCDENQIGQVIDNIILNAKHAMPMGGCITVACRNVSLDKGPGRQDNFVCISIADQGIGMPREILQRIFDPFFTTKEAGHGLGLATAFSIIQHHEGWIDVESEPGKGSVFRIMLPASMPFETAYRGSEKDSSVERGTVLVMDDEPFIRDVLGKMLSDFGFKVLSAEDGSDAISRFSDADRAGNRIAFTILDLTVPGGMGGRETIVQLRAIQPNAVVVAASGYSEDPVMSDPVAHGFNDRIVKPFRKLDIAALIERLLPKMKTSAGAG